MAGENFYIKLPCNDGSKKYFPNNTNNSWKNKLAKRIDLEWEVGLSGISLPHDSIMDHHLKGLTPDSLLLITARKQLVISNQSTTNQIYKVTYGEIKRRRIDTAHDLLKAMFDVERNKCVFDLGNAWATGFANGESVHFMVIADDEGETFTVTAKDVSSSIFKSDIRSHIYFCIRADLCELMGWPSSTDVSYYSGGVLNTLSVDSPGSNLITHKIGRSWTVSRSLKTQNVYNRYDINSIQSSGTDMKKFYLSEIVWTFANTKRGTSKKESFARTLYLYSSLCAPVTMGDQTTDLLRLIYYHPFLKGSFYYEPKQIHYIPLRMNHIDEIETQISESESNHLAQFTDGASIVTLHFRRIR